MDWSVSLFLRERWQISVLILPIYRKIIWVLTWVWINLCQTHKWLLCWQIYAPCVFFWEQVTDPPMYNVATAVLFRSLAIVRSLPLHGCGFAIVFMVKRELVALLWLSSWCLAIVSALWLFLAVPWVGLRCVIVVFTGLEVMNLEYSLRLKVKRNDWLLADTCPQAANQCALFTQVLQPRVQIILTCFLDWWIVFYLKKEANIPK